MELDEFVYLYVYFLSFFGTFFMKPVCVAFDLIYLLLQHLVLRGSSEEVESV